MNVYTTEKLKQCLIEKTNENGEVIRLELPPRVRLAWFNEAEPNATIKTKITENNQRYCIAKAKVVTPQKSSVAFAEATIGDNFTSTISASQTFAIDKCLRHIGYVLPEEICADIPRNPTVDELVDDEIHHETQTKNNKQAEEAKKAVLNALSPKSNTTKEQEQSSSINSEALPFAGNDKKEVSEKQLIISDEKANKLNEMLKNQLSVINQDELIQKCKETKITTGTHKGKTFGEMLVNRKDIEYLMWLVANRATTDQGKKAFMLLKLEKKI